MNCPVCGHAVAGRQCTNCGARVSADGLWAYRGGAQQAPPAGQYPPGSVAQQAPAWRQGQAYQQVGPQGGVYAPGPNPMGQATGVAVQPKKRRAGRRLGILAVLAVVLVGAVGGYLLTHRSGSNNNATTGPTPVAPIRRNFGPMVAVSGTVLAQLRHVQKVGPLSGSTPMEAEVALNVRDAQGLERFVRDVYDPGSSSFHQFLTPSTFAAQYAPRPTERSNVAGWLAAKGLRVTAEPDNGLLIVATGTAGQMARAFGTTIDRYSDGSGFTFYANSTAIHVPRDLAGTVLDVDGLNNIGHVASSARPGSAPHDSSTGYTPQELRLAYNMSSLYGAGMDGSNQTIALAEWGDFSQSDIDTYDHEFGLSTTKPERISVPFDGAQAHTGAGQDEVELDIEVLHAIAPRAHLLVYVSPQTNGAGLAQANAVVSDDRASIVSVSWGFPDVIAPTGVLAAIDQVLAEGAAQGQAILVASGDSGAYDDANAPTTPIVDYPSSDPFVTAVGGTSLLAGSSGYESETVWGDHHNKTGSGGGLSLYFKRPWYQSGPGVVNEFSSPGTRQTPDVAANADPNTGYRVYVTSKGQTGWADFGGTSASTPLWSGYVALVQQKLNRRLGFLNPLLYQMGQESATLPGSPYHDITSGDNLFYKATPAWDFATGWGSMNGANMLQDIQQLEGK